MFSQTDWSNLPDLLVAPHPAITQGVPLESDVSMDPQLPENNGNFTGTRDEKGLTGHQQSLK